MDKDQINLLFDRAAGHWNQDFYTDTKKSIKRSWFHFLSDVSYETACHAVDLIAETSRAFPHAIDIRHVVLRMNMSAAEAPPTSPRPGAIWPGSASVRSLEHTLRLIITRLSSPHTRKSAKTLLSV